MRALWAVFSFVAMFIAIAAAALFMCLFAPEESADDMEGWQ